MVDDDEIMLGILGCILESGGYGITKAIDGEQALNALNTDCFDVVVTDLHLGSINGFDVIRKTKAISGKTIAILITGCYNSSDRLEALRYGADDFLLKPFSSSDLLLCIKNHSISVHGNNKIVS